MLRIAIPYGLLSTRQLRKLGDIARRYDRGYGHFTTRQNLQLNWPKLEHVPDILAELATVQMHCHPDQRQLRAQRHRRSPRRDRPRRGRRSAPVLRDHPPVGDAASRVHLPAAQVQDRHHRLAGGPRRLRGARHRPAPAARRATAASASRCSSAAASAAHPIIGQVIREFLPLPDLLAYLEAILRVYNRYGRRDNIHKARIKVLVKALGIDALPRGSRGRVAGRPRHRAAPWRWRKSSACAPSSARQPYETAGRPRRRPPAASRASRPGTATTRARTRCPAIARCSSHSRPTATIPGDMTSEQMEAVAALADRVSFGLVRATHNQNLLLADVRRASCTPCGASSTRSGSRCPTSARSPT